MEQEKVDQRGALGTTVFSKLLLTAGKLVAVLKKGLVALKVTKVGSLAISTSLYSILFSWKFALIVVSALLIHEIGHVLALRYYDMEVKTINFIPLLGAYVKTGDEKRPDLLSSVVIAMAGPFMGLLNCLGLLLLSFLTGRIDFAAAAAWVALINLINCLPVPMFDGGHAIRPLLLSVPGWIGTSVMWIVLGVTVYTAYQTHFSLLTIGWIFASVQVIAVATGTIRYKEKMAKDLETKKRGRLTQYLSEKFSWYRDYEAWDRKKTEEMIAENCLESEELKRYTNQAAIRGHALGYAALMFLGVPAVLWILVHRLNETSGVAIALEALKH